MKVTKLIFAFAAVTSVASSAAFGQSGGLQQPESFNPVATESSVALAVQQPAAYAVEPAITAADVTLQQPESFASYRYDEPDKAADSVAEEYTGHDRMGGNGSDYSDSCDEPNCICGFDFGGWIEQGVTFNSHSPSDRYNGPVGLNDRSNDYQMNQFWLYAEREVDNGGCGWDWGARADAVYGTDTYFFQMNDGLEASWGQDETFYQVALLRFYVDVAYDDWTLRTGRFDCPVGYEAYEATESFFYSRSYNFMAQPGSMLASVLTRHLNDNWSVSGGMQRGTDQFDDTDGKNALDGVGGVSYLSDDEASFFDAYLIAQEVGPGPNKQYHYSVVGGTPINCNWDYVTEWYWGNSRGEDEGEWYGLQNQFIRTINDCWSYGFRAEWFRDDDGIRVFGQRPGNPAVGPFNGDFYELTFAVNYTPCENFALRPELRWDWYDASNGGPQPFADGTRDNQFLASIDAIYAF